MVQNNVQCCFKETDEILCEWFDSVDWSIFKDFAANLDKYAPVVTDFIDNCVEDCIPKKIIPQLKSMGGIRTSGKRTVQEIDL